jgi:hypothetical protein
VSTAISVPLAVGRTSETGNVGRHLASRLRGVARPNPGQPDPLFQGDPVADRPIGHQRLKVLLRQPLVIAGSLDPAPLEPAEQHRVNPPVWA